MMKDFLREKASTAKIKRDLDRASLITQSNRLYKKLSCQKKSY